MLSRFRYIGINSVDPEVINYEDEWRNGVFTYVVSPGQRFDSIQSNEEAFGDVFTGTLNASMTGNVGSVSGVKVIWVFRPVGADWPCKNPPSEDWILHTRFPGMGNNAPYQMTPSSPLLVPTDIDGTPFPTLSTGATYKVCAVIDPDGDFPETSENDNVIFTEHSYAFSDD